MGKPTYTLGLSYSHDASACLIKDGIPILAIQKERITRKKHDGSIADINLDECIKYCLDAEGIQLKDIDMIVENSPTILYCKDKDKILGYNQDRLLDKVNPNKIIQISHHLAHAFCVFGISPFEECAVMIIDGQGNYKEDLSEDISDTEIFPQKNEDSYIERESFYEFKGNSYKTLRKNLTTIHKSFTNICGLGHMYERIASFIFKSRFDAGKLMGLAPYGKDSYNFNFTNLKNNGEITYNTHWIKQINKNAKTIQNNDPMKYSDLAYKAQSELEKSIKFLTKWLRKKSKLKNLAYSGGVSLNCGSNMIIQDKGGFEKFFIAPPASDAGISMGCAYYAYLYLLKKNKKSFTYLDYLGKEYTNQEIKLALNKYNSEIKYYKASNVYKETAKLISEQKIIGWFQGKSEFGPRALGNRSIVADPRDKKMIDLLNQKIKFREEFRPFGPSVLQEKAAEYFNINNSPFMLLTADVVENKKKEIPAVVHVDGTSRIQTVTQKQNLKYYNLINEFYKITGVPLLINTSFNVKGEPIVETPDDAIRNFLGGNLDHIVIHDYILSK